MNTVGRNIQKLRQTKKVTQEEIAAALNVTRQAISSWENGKTQPDIDTLQRLSAYFEVSMEELIYGEKRPGIVCAAKEVNMGKVAKTGITFGTCLAMVISYYAWHSIGWAILHGIFGWGYVIYYLIRYVW